MVTIAALLTCHNRRESTQKSLCALRRAIVPGVETFVVAVDDGSTDGTAVAIEQGFPGATVLRGDGTLYWAGGMAVAHKHAVAGSPDYLLWLNDDVVLASNALNTLLSCVDQFDSPQVVVGAVVDPDHPNRVSYSGSIRYGKRPRSLVKMGPTGFPLPVDTFNGNVVLIPRAVYEVVGPIDERYVHGYGDHDYGFRVRAAGFDVTLAPEPVGTCKPNRNAYGLNVGSGSRMDQIRRLFGPKGMPLGPHLHYTRSHGGRGWLLVAAGGYCRAIAKILIARRNEVRSSGTELADNAARIADGNAIGWDVPHHDGTGANY